MEWIFASFVGLLFLLAAFDLWVGVSNDAVNFLNSAIGSRAARFRTLVIIASIGVFMGACLSNGMMDIARHGIFAPQYFSYREVMLIFLAVMVTDIVLLDVFNSFGMPTSTTVSMVFELLGASFAFVLIKMATDGLPLSMGDYLNTSKALEVIIGIFLSVPIAFVSGMVVQYVSRLLFSFDLTRSRGLRLSLFGGLAVTAILYFMLFKGLKSLAFMQGDVKACLQENTGLILLSVFVVATLLMCLLQWLKVSVLRIVVLFGTFALATAFAGNDLVNFIGVPLAGFSSFGDYMSHSGGLSPDAFMMTSLTESARTPLVFLVGAGAIMVVSLATSKKARRVVETEVGLSRRDEGEEMFGSSRVARSLVRWGTGVGQVMNRCLPTVYLDWARRRFRQPLATNDDHAAYDLVRASVNLCVAALLIALGTSLKLPLSTTFVTFMVAMGSSLSDGAWSRESAVFRITGVLTVIGGWFITAGVAFSAAFFVGGAMHFGGWIVVVVIICGAVYSLIHSQRRFSRKQKELTEQGDVLFKQMLAATSEQEVLPMLRRHIRVNVAEQMDDFAQCWQQLLSGLTNENLRGLRRVNRDLGKKKQTLKSLRRRETICLQRASATAEGVSMSTGFHLLHNSLTQLYYSLRRIAEPSLEHVDNHFTPIKAHWFATYEQPFERLAGLMSDISSSLRRRCEETAPAVFDAERGLKRSLTDTEKQLAALRHEVTTAMENDTAHFTTLSLLLHLVQETEQTVIELRHLVRNLRMAGL